MNDTDKQTMLIFTGLPASGKTTEAIKWVAEDPQGRVRINYDDLRISMFGNEWVFNRPQEAAMKEEAFKRAVDAIGAGKSICIDNTNLTPMSREMWITLAKGAGLAYEIHEISTTIDECVARDRRRVGRARVGQAVIDQMALNHGFIDWKDERAYPRDFLIVDMDGTLSDCSWRKHYVRIVPGVREKKDWPAFYKGVGDDPPNAKVKRIITELATSYDILVVTGRPIDLAGIGTEDWLRENCPNLPVRHIFMRSAGDSRLDSITKKDILDLLPKERVAAVFDDRDRVVQMWRNNGLLCLQVDQGDF